MYPYLLECELPLQTAHEYKRLEAAAGVYVAYSTGLVTGQIYKRESAFP